MSTQASIPPLEMDIKISDMGLIDSTSMAPENGCMECHQLTSSSTSTESIQTLTIHNKPITSEGFILNAEAQVS